MTKQGNKIKLQEIQRRISDENPNPVVFPPPESFKVHPCDQTSIIDADHAEALEMDKVSLKELYEIREELYNLHLRIPPPITESFIGVTDRWRATYNVDRELALLRYERLDEKYDKMLERYLDGK